MKKQNIRFFYLLSVTVGVVLTENLNNSNNLTFDFENKTNINIKLNLSKFSNDRDKKNQILSFSELRQFELSLNLVQNFRCRNDLNLTLWSINDGLPWAISMYDSSSKIPFGVGHGQVYQFGSFDQCMEINKNHHHDGEYGGNNSNIIKSKYCLADVKIDGLIVKEIATRHPQSKNATDIHWGVCMPETCDAKDIEIFMQSLLQYPVNVNEKMCFTHQEFVLTNGMLIYGVFIAFFIGMALIGTTLHLLLLWCKIKSTKKIQSDNCFELTIKAFSVIENVKKLGQASKDQLGLNSINGIKAIAMILIIVGHALCFTYGGPVLNSKFMADNISAVQNAVFTNSILFVDAFLVLSGFLFSRILLIELERRRGKLNPIILYLGRYIRLTPAYLAILMFYITWFPFIGSGPLWNKKILVEKERCEETWWLNILYINNYFKTDNLCMFQSWYLSVDTQLFFLAPPFIILFYKSRKYGAYLMAAIAIIVSSIPFAVTYFNKLDPTFLVYPDEVTDLGSNEFYRTSYIKTHMRATGYVLGLLTGFIVHVMQEKKIKINSILVGLLWIVSIFIGISSMYSVALFYMQQFSVLHSALYAGLHKIGWCTSVSWLVIAVTTGHAPGLQRFLSSRFFAPISRLTYCAYLSNGLVELYHAGTIKYSSNLTSINLMNVSLSHTFDTFLLAFIICLLFESPIHALERALLRKEKKKIENTVVNESRTPSTSEEQIP